MAALDAEATAGACACPAARARNAAALRRLAATLATTTGDDPARAATHMYRHVVLGHGPSHPLFGLCFMRYYLPHYCSEGGAWVEPADWHGDLFQTVFTSMGSGDWFDYLAPRGFAKSTIVTLALPLAALGLGGLALAGELPYPLNVKHYVWIVQDTSDQAKQALESLLSETETNPRAQEDFPHLVPATGKHGRPVADRDDDVVFASGQRIQALGAGQKVRGRRHRQHRPDLVLIDDLENDEHVLTKYQRDKLDGWLNSALSFAVGKNAEVHMVGTLLHSDAVLARVGKRAGWKHRRYEAFHPLLVDCPDHGWRVDPDVKGRYRCDLCRDRGRVPVGTWGYRDVYWHARMRSRVGEPAYNREVLHVVTDESRKRFPAASFNYGPRPEGDDVRVRIGVDPATGEKQTRDEDLSAIVVVMKRRGEAARHVDFAWAQRVRGRTLERKVRAVWRLYRMLGYDPVVVAEKVQAQAWLKQGMEDDGVPVVGRTPVTDKLTRAESTATHYEQGRFQHALELRGSEFEACLDEFPDGEHDDYVDALVYASRELDVETAGGLAGVVRRGPGERAKRRQREWVDPRAS